MAEVQDAIPDAGFNPTPEARNLPDSSAAPMWGATVEAPPDTPWRKKAPDDMSAFMPTPEQHEDAIQGATNLQELKLKADDQANRLWLNRTEQDRQREHAYFNAEAYSAGNLPKPWNADKERAERIRGPFEKFGDVATVFAMIASGFSKQPMISALNAGAAAMNAIQSSDEKGYEAAYTAWKDNTQLAIKRFDMQHQLFTDTQHMFNNDITAWKTEMLANAAKFKDEQQLNLLRNGMYPELFEAEEKRAKAADAMRESLEHAQYFETNREAWIAGRKEIDEKFDPKDRKKYQLNIEARRAMEAEFKAKSTEERMLWQKQREYILDNGRVMPVEEATKLWHDLKTRYGAGSKGPLADQKFIEQFYEEHPDATPEEFSKAFGEFKRAQKYPPGGGAGGGNPNLTAERQIADAVKHKIEQWRSEGKSEDEINTLAAAERRKLRAASTPPSGNQKEKLEGHIDQFTNSIKTIDKVLEVLNNYPGAAGLAGKVMRLEERLGNIMGSDDADRVQMMRDISLLQAIAPQLLLDRTGRPLSAEAAHANDIVAGLSAGDTGVNTIRAMEELRKRYEMMRNQATKRLKGEHEEPPVQEPPSTPAAPGGWWNQDKPK